MQISPTTFISALTLAAALLSDRRENAPRVAQLTDMEGEPILVQSHQVFAIYPSTVRLREQRATMMHVIGLDEPLEVREDPNVVVHRLGGGWRMLHSPGAWLGLGKGKVEVYVDPARVVTVEKSSYRLNTQSTPLTYVNMVQGFRLQVIEDVPAVGRILGM